MNKYLAYLIATTAILFSLASHAYYDDEDHYRENRYENRYENRHYRLICDPYTNVCHKVYYSPYSHHWQSHTRKKIVPEPRFVFKAPPEKINDGNINLSHGTWAAYDSQGELVNSGRVSGGRSYCSDINKKCKTATGTFKIYEKRGASCKSKIFPVGKGGAPMPYCMFFHQGFAMHGSNAVPNYN
ncbi:MAG TPA: L,D-transpeptidase, partial [Candidatus Berkiella sp.]|nr:L,D-transpeptidase [Candidatus Berkiella sp.]